MAQKRNRVFQSAFNTYTLGRPIGRGGSGIVYEASDVEGQRVATKVIDPAKGTSDKLKRFQNETRFCQRNTHRNIITVLDHGRGPDGEPFYVMPLYPFTLQDVTSKGILPSEVMGLFAQLLDGVEAAHLQQVVHRDLKPQNILCDGQRSTLVIADFGIASFEEEDLYTAVETRQNDRLANFQYASPEQRARGREITPKADIFSLGLILNEMFTGEIPQGTSFKTISSVAPDHAYLDDLVNRMMHQDPSQRPSIVEVKRDLLARREQFISLQKIHQLTKQVVPETVVDDPLVIKPIQLANVDYAEGRLVFELSSSPNVKWINEFHQQGNVTSFLGRGPGVVTFHGVHASIDVSGLSEQNIPNQVGYFKSWIANANLLYAHRIEREAKEEWRARQKLLDAELAEQRKRQRILSELKW
jgi:serine/threonine protein kinase